jgi:DNA-binding MarR family transcriptional regulator
MDENKQLKTLRGAAADYIQNGMSVIPYAVKAGERVPLLKWKRKGLHLRPGHSTMIDWILQKKEQDQTPHGIGIFGGTREGLLICDSEKLDFHDELERRLGETWSIDTSNRGGHLYYRIVDPATGETVPVESRSFRRNNETICDFIAHGKWAVAPPSIHHKTGQPYRTRRGDPAALLNISLKDLTFLETYGIEIVPASIVHERARPPHFPRLAWNILKGFPECPPNKQRAHYEFRAILSLAVHGYDWPMTLAAFVEHAHENTHFKTRLESRGHQNAVEWLRRSYEKAGRNIREQFLSPARLDLQHLIDRLAQTSLRNDERGFQKALLLVAAKVGFDANTTRPAISRRRWAEMAAVSEKTVTRYVQRLVADGYLRPVPSETDSQATVYEIETGLFGPLLTLENAPGAGTPIKPLSSGGTSGVHAPGRNRIAVASLYHDVFRYSALGKLGFAVWCELKEHPDGIEPLKLQVIARGTSNSSVYKILRRMEKALLVVREPRRVCIRADADLDRAAQLLNVTGKGARQRARHDLERKAYQVRIREAKEKQSGLFGEAGSDETL